LFTFGLKLTFFTDLSHRGFSPYFGNDPTDS